MFETINSVDASVFLTLHNAVRCMFMDCAAWWMSDRWIWVPMYSAVLYMLIRRLGWRRAIVYALAIGVAVALADQLCATFIRPFVERMRPSNPDNPLSQYVTLVNGYHGGRYGFPSCHAANTFVLAVFVTLVVRNRALVCWMFVWAVLTCLSRIYLGVHYPGDLFVGAMAGSFCAWFVWWMLGLTRLRVPRINDTTGWRAMPVIVGVATLVVIAVLAILNIN